MEKVKQLLNQLHERIDGLTLRERAILFIVISSVLFSGTDYLLLKPLELKQQRLLNQIQTIQTENSTIEIQTLAIINRHKADPNLAERQQIERLNRELDAASGKIEASVGRLITPEQMSIALENILQRQQGLKFISLENLPAKPFMENLGGGQGEGASTALEKISVRGIYQHSFTLQFEGSYLNTLSYLRELEALEWSFRWDEIELTMLDYPTARVKIMIHTISLDEGIIGV
ncbi:MAG: hypothetical protein GQ470_05980 [Gammaproteobacteria bacterium]|nr:hypothetical protein [Gammaproteobacteria bacterium]